MCWFGAEFTGAFRWRWRLASTLTFRYRAEILTLAFGVVAFSIIVQGLTVKPLLRLLHIEALREDEYDVAKVRIAANSAGRRELDLPDARPPDFSIGLRKLGSELDAQTGQVELEIASMLERNRNITAEELRIARVRLIAAEKSAIQRAANQGLISIHTAEGLLGEADRKLDQEIREGAEQP